MVIYRKNFQSLRKGNTIMSKVLLEEGGSVNVHTRIKDMCRAARNRLGLTNQDISNRISERFGIEDFSVNTVNNFFSERSKATTIYTTGYICAVLDISMDAVFGIEKTFSTAEEAEFVRQLSELKVELRFKDQQIDHLEKTINEKNERIAQSHKALDYYREEMKKGKKHIPAWVFAIILGLLAGSIIFIAVYLIYFDLGNPDYGLFREKQTSAEETSLQPETYGIPDIIRNENNL